MFAQVLVPLDGSRCAASAIPIAATLARAWHCPITLIGVQAPRHRGGWLRVAGTDERDGTCNVAYLDDQAAMLRRQGLCVTTLLRQGNPSDEILAAARAADRVLIVMTTHGWGGERRARVGGVAQRVIKRATAPILLVRTDVDATINPIPAIWDITVMLDGSGCAEAVLERAARLARALAVPLTLLHVVPNAFFFATVTQSHEESHHLPQEEIDAYHQVHEERAARYLDAVAARMSTPGLTVRTDVTRSVTHRASDGFTAYLAKRPHAFPIIPRDVRAGRIGWAHDEMLKSVLRQMPSALLLVPAEIARGASGGERDAFDGPDGGIHAPPLLAVVPKSHSSQVGQFGHVQQG